jgi:hypothetical protein
VVRQGNVGTIFEPPHVVPAHELVGDCVAICGVEGDKIKGGRKGFLPLWLRMVKGEDTATRFEGVDPQAVGSVACESCGIRSGRAGANRSPVCLSPSQPSTSFENAIHAVKSIKPSVPLNLIALTTMDEWMAPLRDSGVGVCLKAPFAANELLDAVSASA